MTTYMGREIDMCPTCGHLIYTDDGSHVHSFVITRECAKGNVIVEKREMDCCDAHFDSAYGTRMFSIVKRTVNGRVRFEAEWLPTRCRARFDTKREATAWVKAHEKRCYGK